MCQSNGVARVEALLYSKAACSHCGNEAADNGNGRCMFCGEAVAPLPHCRGCDAVISVVTARDLGGYYFACHEEAEDYWDYRGYCRDCGREHGLCECV